MDDSKRRNNIIARFYALKTDAASVPVVCESILFLCNVINTMKRGVVTNTDFLPLHKTLMKILLFIVLLTFTFASSVLWFCVQ